MQTNIITAAVGAVVVAGALGSARFLFRFILRAITHDFRTTVTDIVSNHLEDLKQLKPNGGSSLRDAVDRIEKRLDDIEQRIQK